MIEEKKDIEETQCKNCQSKIITYNNYPVWCQKCEWNLMYEDNLKPQNKLEEFNKKISKKYGNNLFEQIKNEDFNKINKKLTKTGLIVYSVSLLIIVLNLLLLISGFYLLFFLEHFYIKFIGLLCLGLFYLSKPRRIKMNSEKFVSKINFPELYKTVNLICTKLKTSDIQGIIIDESFNASITEYGLKKKKVLFIGFPLWSILNNDERLALIGHEISHCVNGDPARSKLVSIAINILIDTGWAIYPSTLAGDIMNPYIGGLRASTLELSKYAVIPLNLALRGISHLLWKLAYFLNNLIWIDSQKSEYLADILGSTISGHKSAISLMEKLGYQDIFYFELKKIVLKGKKEADKINIFKTVNEKIENFPNHEIERLKRLQMKEEHRFDIKHPPTYSRILILKEKGYKNLSNIKDQINFGKIENEFNNYEKKIQDKLIDIYRNSMYY
jgi:Zn-dependent protease with chaperone function